MTQHRSLHRKTEHRSRLGNEDGIALIVAMVFVLIFIVLGVALYWLVASQTRSVETERSDVKSFNVAEAGIDAGMLALKLTWPTESDDYAYVSDSLLKSQLQGDPNLTGLWDPRDPTEFIQVEIYDNVDAWGDTTSVPNMDPATRVFWDSNKDGWMFIDATANVDNDRHRILIVAEQQNWTLAFPETMALFAGIVDSNGSGLGIAIEDGEYCEYDVHDSLHKGLDDFNPDYDIRSVPSPTAFDEIFNAAMCRALEGIARNTDTYYTDDDPAEATLVSGNGNGKVVYVDVDDGGSVDISSSVQIGTVDEPVVVVIDTRDSPGVTEVGWDMKGTADFYGIIVAIGDATLRGTCSTHGAVYCANTLLNKGTGAYEEIYYNRSVILNINRQYTISVNLVPNTWEEYTLPRTETTVAGP